MTKRKRPRWVGVSASGGTTVGTGKPPSHAVPLIWPSGKPVLAGDIQPGSVIDFDRKTGVVKSITPPIREAKMT
jgi:hypothetical protein